MQLLLKLCLMWLKMINMYTLMLVVEAQRHSMTEQLSQNPRTEKCLPPNRAFDGATFNFHTQAAPQLLFCFYCL